jgi:Protein of unknown function (DUF1579)
MSSIVAEGGTMRRNLVRMSLASAVVVVALATLAAAQGQKPPEMTPEQKAEMEAYQKAGIPGAPHQELASSVGTYDLKIKSWHEPGGPAMEDTGTATRSMALGGPFLVEAFTGSMMGMPFTGHGMTGFDNQFLDLAPKGRDEGSDFPQEWVRHRDRYPREKRRGQRH